MATAASRLSSSRARARLALWLVAAGLVGALLVGYLVVDRGGNGRRDAVAAYIEEANSAQRGLLTRLGAINTAYARLRLSPQEAAAQTPALVEGRRQIAASRARLAALEPPRDARVLHARLLHLLTLETALARDVTELARHLSIVMAARSDLAAATARLSNDLRTASGAPGQARAFERYAARLDAAAARIAPTSVPVLLRPSRREDVRRLDAISALAGELGPALEASKTAVVSDVLRRLEREVRTMAALPGGRLLVGAYNRRVRAIGGARTAVAVELNRLNREL